MSNYREDVTSPQYRESYINTSPSDDYNNIKNYYNFNSQLIVPYTNELPIPQKFYFFNSEEEELFKKGFTLNKLTPSQCNNKIHIKYLKSTGKTYYKCV
jgi:hypothetical protein